MGCCYSCEEDDRRESAYAPTAWSSRSNHDPHYNNVKYYKAKPLYGEYKCSCGYFWVSRLSWPDKYQQCKRCKAHVKPKNQRELRNTDYTRNKDEVKEHPQELCQMCKQLGAYCGKYK